MARSILVVCFALAVLAVPAGARAQVTDQRVWFAAALQDKDGGSPWHWAAEMLARSRNGVDDFDSAGLRFYVTRDVSSRSTVGGAYGLTLVYPAAGRDLTEHRFIGQYALRFSLAGGSLSFRTRFEDRWILDDTGHVFRFRQQVRYSHPLGGGNRWYLVGHAEIFVHLNSTNRYAKGVEQTRGFGGAGFRFSPTARFEAGYLNQFTPGRNGAPDRMNHVLSMGLQFLF